MRTIGEMAVTTLVHANLPQSAWGHAVLYAVEVINRTADSAETNSTTGFPAHFYRLEKWKGKELPGQTKGLYPLGCAFKHIPSALRTKLEQHATPAVYLGFAPNCRAYLLGSLYGLDLSVSVEVTFVENVFPFRKIKHRESPASLLWGTDNNLTDGDGRLGMFETHDSTGISKVLDRQALKSIGALPPDTEDKHEDPSLATAPQTLLSHHDAQPDPATRQTLSKRTHAFPGKTIPRTRSARPNLLLRCLLSLKRSWRPSLPNLQIEHSHQPHARNGWLR
jgi:hypothetical protein